MINLYFIVSIYLINYFSFLESSPEKCNGINKSDDEDDDNAPL